MFPFLFPPSLLYQCPEPGPHPRLALKVRLKSGPIGPKKPAKSPKSPAKLTTGPTKNFPP